MEGGGELCMGLCVLGKGGLEFISLVARDILVEMR
jgi:hypothetical protein